MKNKFCLILSLALLILNLIIPITPTIKLLVIFAVSIFMWITLPIELGSLICIACLMLLPEVTPSLIYNASFGSGTIVFLIFSMLLTYGLSETGILRRIALWFINNPVAKKNKYTFIGFYFLSMLIIGSVIAPTTLFILFYGIANEIYDCMELRKGDQLAKVMMIGTGFFASISCAITPIAHTFPIMALGFYETATGTAISYTEYMKYSLPIGIILAIAAYILLITTLKGEWDIKVNFTLPKISIKEIIATIIFILVILAWIITGIWPTTFAKLNSLGTAFPAIIGCALLACFGCLNIKQGMSKGVSWSAILLCSATLALGKVLTIEAFGINTLIINVLGTEINMLLVILFSVILTNIISNIVTTTLAFNIFVPAMIAGTVSQSPVVATIAIGIGASLAYALPSSIAHIALVGSSGWASSKDMMRYGAAMIVISILVMVVII